jgi:hypothetical protein
MPSRFPILAVLLAALLVCDAATAAKLYKWVDEKGNVYYSDQVPPEEIKREHSRLSEQGVEVERREAAKSEEQLRQEQEIARLRRLQQELIEEQEAEDRVLLSNFRTEEDLLMARAGKIATIDSQIRLSTEDISRNKKRLESMEANAADLERRGQSASDRFLRQIEEAREAIEELHLKIVGLERQKTQISAQFERDLNRFQQLRQLEDYNKPAKTATSETSPASILDSTVLCFDASECNRLWEMTKSYVRKHATTRLQTIGKRVIVTSAPIKDDDVSLTASRIPELELGRERIFLDIQCRESILGREFCNGAEVAKIRTGFRAALKR